MIMVNLAKSWLTRLTCIMISHDLDKGTMGHGTLVKIMANHDTWNACQDHGKIMARSWQDNHGLSWPLPRISCQKFD